MHAANTITSIVLILEEVMRDPLTPPSPSLSEDEVEWKSTSGTVVHHSCAISARMCQFLPADTTEQWFEASWLETAMQSLQELLVARPSLENAEV